MPISDGMVHTPEMYRSIVAGKWNMSLASPTDPQQMVGHFDAAGGFLIGFLTVAEGRQEFTGPVDDNKVKFELAVTQPMKIMLKYDRQVAGDAIFGKMKIGMFDSAKPTGSGVLP